MQMRVTMQGLLLSARTHAPFSCCYGSELAWGHSNQSYPLSQELALIGVWSRGIDLVSLEHGMMVTLYRFLA